MTHSSSNQTNETALPEIYPLQNFQSEMFFSIYHFYTISQRETGLYLMQISHSICWVAIIIWIFSFMRNKKVHSLLLISNIQFIYTLSILENNFPPNLNQFLEGFQLSMFIFGFETELIQSEPLWKIDSVLRE